MAAVPIRTLNQDTAGVLARVEHGETIEITRRGKVIGRIVPVADGEIDDLVLAGRVAPATVSGPWIAPTGSPTTSTAAAGRIRHLRDEQDR